MSSIVTIDLGVPTDALTGSILKDFKLTGQNGTASPILEAGRTEEVGGQLYQVIDGNFPVSDISVGDGLKFLYIEDQGGGTVVAELSDVVPTWTGQGWYDSNRKCIYVMFKGGAAYYQKERVEVYYHDDDLQETYVSSNINNSSGSSPFNVANLTLGPGLWEIKYSMNAMHRVVAGAVGIIKAEGNYYLSNSSSSIPGSPLSKLKVEHFYTKSISGGTFAALQEDSTNIHREIKLEVSTQTTFYIVGDFTGVIGLTSWDMIQRNIWLRARRIRNGNF